MAFNYLGIVKKFQLGKYALLMTKTGFLQIESLTGKSKEDQAFIYFNYHFHKHIIAFHCLYMINTNFDSQKLR